MFVVLLYPNYRREHVSKDASKPSGEPSKKRITRTTKKMYCTNTMHSPPSATVELLSYLGAKYAMLLRHPPFFLQTFGMILSSPSANRENDGVVKTRRIRTATIRPINEQDPILVNYYVDVYYALHVRSRFVE